MLEVIEIYKMQLLKLYYNSMKFLALLQILQKANCWIMNYHFTVLPFIQICHKFQECFITLKYMPIIFPWWC